MIKLVAFDWNGTLFADTKAIYEADTSQVLVVGDNIEEIHVARELGTKIAAITHGNCSTARLKAAKPDYLINNLKEVRGIIEN